MDAIIGLVVGLGFLALLFRWVSRLGENDCVPKYHLVSEEYPPIGVPIMMRFRSLLTGRVHQQEYRVIREVDAREYDTWRIVDAHKLGWWQRRKLSRLPDGGFEPPDHPYQWRSCTDLDPENKKWVGL